MIGESDLEVGYAAGLHGSSGKDIRMVLGFAFSHIGFDVSKQFGEKMDKMSGIVANLSNKPNVPSYLSMRGLGM